MLRRIIMMTAVFGGLVAGAAHADDLNPVVGKVGDFVIREADLARLEGYQSAEGQKQLQDDPEKRVMMVKQLLTGKAVAARARKDGWDKKPEVKEQLSYVMDEFLSREYIYRTVIAPAVVPEEELKKFYKDNEKDLVLAAEVKVRHIHVSVPKEATAEDKAKARAKADGLLQRLKKGEDFAKLAKEFSDDPASAPKGGELGFIAAGGSLESFEKAAFALKAGETSDIVETPYGFHIIKVDERREERIASFDDAKEFIRKKLQGEYERKKAQEFIDKIAKEAGVEVYEDKILGPKEKAK